MWKYPNCSWMVYEISERNLCGSLCRETTENYLLYRDIYWVLAFLLHWRHWHLGANLFFIHIKTFIENGQKHDYICPCLGIWYSVPVVCPFPCFHGLWYLDRVKSCQPGEQLEDMAPDSVCSLFQDLPIVHVTLTSIQSLSSHYSTRSYMTVFFPIVCPKHRCKCQRRWEGREKHP